MPVERTRSIVSQEPVGDERIRLRRCTAFEETMSESVRRGGILALQCQRPLCQPATMGNVSVLRVRPAAMALEPPVIVVVSGVLLAEVDARLVMIGHPGR